MQKVTGIGGVFFKAKDPQALSQWYTNHLGIDMPPTTYDDPGWRQEAGPTVFAPMHVDSEHFAKHSELSINFRVNDLAVMCAQLGDAGIDVRVDPDDYPNGKFASLNDPEGNQIQLWEVESPS